MVEQREGGRGDGHRRVHGRPQGIGVREERGHECHGRPADGPQPDAGQRGAGHPSRRRSRGLRVPERPGHAAAGPDARDADAGAGGPGRGIRHDAGGVRHVGAVPFRGDHPGNPQLLQPIGIGVRAGRPVCRTGIGPGSGAFPFHAGSEECRGKASRASRAYKAPGLLHGRPAVQPDPGRGQTRHRGCGIRLPQAARRAGRFAREGHAPAQARHDSSPAGEKGDGFPRRL